MNIESPFSTEILPVTVTPFKVAFPSTEILPVTDTVPVVALPITASPSIVILPDLTLVKLALLEL